MTIHSMTIRLLRAMKILFIYSIFAITALYIPKLTYASFMSTLMDVYEYETILKGDDGELLPSIVYEMTNLSDESGITGVLIATNEAYDYSIGYIYDLQHPAWDVVRVDILQHEGFIYAKEWYGDRIYFGYLPDEFSKYNFGYFYYEGEHDGPSQSLKINETINGYVIGGAIGSPYVYTHDYNPQGSYTYVGYGETRHPCPSTVPEPMSILLFTSGIIGVASIRKNRV